VTACRTILATIAALAAAFSAVPAAVAMQFGPGRSGYESPAPTTDGVPELEGVTIEDRLDAQVPLDAWFVDDTGRRVTIADVLPKDRPVVLQIGYMRCPQLCSLVMNALLRSMQGVDWTPGVQYDVVSVSICPEEKPELAAAKKAGYIAEYGRRTPAAGWHFLTGDESQIRRVADAVGFTYRRQPNGEYSHAAGVFLVTPAGRLSRVLYGVKYEPADLRMGLLEASEGRIGTTIDRIILWCHVYDPKAGGYVLLAMRIMQLGGALTLAVLGGGLGWFWWREARAKRLAPMAAPHAPQH